MIRFFVPGNPIAKQSTRITVRNGKKVRCYTDPRVKAWQETVSLFATRHVNEMLTGKINLELRFILSNNRRVDCDNLSKGVLDGIKGIAFKDDSDIVKLTIEKVVDPNMPGVLVVISGVE